MYRVYALDKQAYIRADVFNSNGQTSIGVSGLDCMPRVQKLELSCLCIGQTSIGQDFFKTAIDKQA